MITINDTDLDKNICSYMDKVIQENEVIIVLRENNQNVVMLSEERYNNLMKDVL